jgi:hypothetical protein
VFCRVARRFAALGWNEISQWLKPPIGLVRKASPMTERIRIEVLDEIERRCAAATQGPWISYVEGRDHTSGDSFIRTAGDDIYLSGTTVADQDFIAHARQDLPALIREIRALHKERGA